MSSSHSKKQPVPAVTPRQTMRGHTSWLNSVMHLPHGRRIITSSSDGSLRVWDLDSGAQIGEDWRDEGEKTAVWGIALSPNGNTIASGSKDGTVKLWDLKKGKVIAKWKGHTSHVYSVCWSADGDRVLSRSEDGTARVWDLESGKTILTIRHGRDSSSILTAVMYSPDNTKIATGGSRDTGIKIWDATSGELIFTLKHSEAVWRLAWTSDGKKLISGSVGGSIRVFDTATWQQIAILEGHTDYINALSLFGNDRLLASASDDKTARLWNLDTNLPVGPPLQHKDHLRCAALSVDGKVLLIGCMDKNAYVWDIQAILNEAGLEDLLSIPNNDAARRPAQLKDPRRLPPGFFDDVRQDGVHSSATRGIHPSSSARHRAPAPSSTNQRALLGRFLALFRPSHSDTNKPTELQQCPRRTLFSPRSPRVIEVPTVRDRRVLVVTRPSQRHHSGPRPVTTFWAYLVLFLCCASPQMAERTQQQQPGQSQDHNQAQASSSQSQPAASTSATPHTSTTTPGPAGTQSRTVLLWTRFVLFLCCASPPHANGH